MAAQELDPRHRTHDGEEGRKEPQPHVEGRNHREHHANRRDPERKVQFFARRLNAKGESQQMSRRIVAVVFKGIDQRVVPSEVPIGGIQPHLQRKRRERHDPQQF